MIFGTSHSFYFGRIVIAKDISEFVEGSKLTVSRKFSSIHFCSPCFVNPVDLSISTSISMGVNNQIFDKSISFEGDPSFYNFELS
jgi:hypothetical protein